MNETQIIKNIIDLRGGFVKNASLPSSDYDLANKLYVDTIAGSGTSGVSYLVFNNYTSQTYTEISTLSSQTWNTINIISGNTAVLSSHIPLQSY